MTNANQSVSPPGGRFRHEAVFYRGMNGFLGRIVPFLREGVNRGEAILVAVDPEKAEAIGEALGPGGAQVRFAPMRELGRNPARIIPAWLDFVEDATERGVGMRGVGEPIWPGRTPAELLECHIHESLLNRAFDDGPPWTLACPYDTAGLDRAVLDQARRNHPFLTGIDGGTGPGGRGATPALEGPLPPSGEPLASMSFDVDSLHTVRRLVHDVGGREGLDAASAGDLALAVHELAANSVVHGGGRGTLHLWRENRSLVAEVRDRGSLRDPLVGRATPSPEQFGGRGLWLVHQLCDLVQVRSTDDGVVVRAHASLEPARLSA